MLTAAIRPKDCRDSDVVSDEAASRLVVKAGAFVEAGTEANPFALPAMAIRTAPVPKRGVDVFIVCRLL